MSRRRGGVADPARIARLEWELGMGAWGGRPRLSELPEGEIPLETALLFLNPVLAGYARRAIDLYARRGYAPFRAHKGGDQVVIYHPTLLTGVWTAFDPQA